MKTSCCYILTLRKTSKDIQMHANFTQTVYMVFRHDVTWACFCSHVMLTFNAKPQMFSCFIVIASRVVCGHPSAAALWRIPCRYFHSECDTFYNASGSTGCKTLPCFHRLRPRKTLENLQRPFSVFRITRLDLKPTHQRQWHALLADLHRHLWSKIGIGNELCLVSNKLDWRKTFVTNSLL